jgi:uncharacterized integral membrane protein (TIGR00698 family)
LYLTELGPWYFPGMKKIAFLILAAATLLPDVPAALALAVGIFFAVTFGNPFIDRTKPLASKILTYSVIGLGFGMNLFVVGRVGVQGIGYTLFTITLSMVAGLLLGKLLKVSREASILISAGTAICGGSAIAAVSAGIKAESENISVSLATVFLLNAAALFIFPPIGMWMGLSPENFGLWAALAVHDTSSVVGTAIHYGGGALEVGTTVKLARSLWIAPLTFLIVIFMSKPGEKKGKITIPWFILGFIGAAALVTYVPSLAGYGAQIAGLARKSLVLVLFLIGSNLTRDTLRKAGVRPMIQGFLLWIIAASVSLAAIHYGIIHL